MQTTDGAADGPHAMNISFDDGSTEGRDGRVSATAKIQRSGSKLLSMVGIQARHNGELLV